MTARDLTLADVSIESYPESKISTMESELLKNISKIRLKPLLIDPKAEMKAQKAAGNTETLVDYDKVGNLAAQAQILYTNHLMESDEAGCILGGDGIFDMQVL